MRKIYLLLSLVIFLVALSRFLKREEEPLFFKGLKVEEVESIQIKTKDFCTTLEKERGEWFVKECRWPADGKLIEHALSALRNIKKMALVCRRKEKYPLFGMEEEKCVKIKGKRSLIFYIGKEASDYFGEYMRKEGEEEVWLCTPPLAHIFLKEPKHWRSKRILYILPKQIKKLTLSKDGKKYTLEKKDGVWRIDGKKAKEAAVKSFLHTLCRMQADRIHEGSPSFKRLFARINILLEDGSSLLLLIKKKDEHIFYLKRQEAVFVLYKHKVEELTPKSTKFLEDEGTP